MRNVQPMWGGRHRVARAIAVSLWLCVGSGLKPAIAQVREPIEPIPPVIAGDPAKVELGRHLFGEVRLSRNRDRSCATCHPLDGFGIDRLPRARAAGDIRILRNTPTIFNTGLNRFINWDGRFESLSALYDFVLQDPALMGSSWAAMEAALKGDPGYVARFGAIYPGGISKAGILDALVSFTRSLTTPNARFDRYLRGDRAALSAAEQSGYQLFKSYGCVACHQGVNVGGNLFQKFGVFANPSSGPRAGETPDAGRFNVTRDAEDRGVFRVPSLRNVALTAPYFHNGQAATLDEAVNTMARVQLGRNLYPEEVGLIVQFLGTLTGEFPGRAPVQQEGGAK